MDQRQLASVLFAVVGLFIALSRLPDIFLQGAMLAQWDPTMEDPASPVPQRLTVALAFSASLLAVLLGAALVLVRQPLAARLFPSTTGPLDARELQAVALSVLGCYFVVQGAYGALWSGSLRWGAIVQAALGVGLFVGARALAGLWSSWRFGSRAQEPG